MQLAFDGAMALVAAAGKTPDPSALVHLRTGF
jgi:hypothetical protein